MCSHQRVCSKICNLSGEVSHKRLFAVQQCEQEVCNQGVDCTDVKMKIISKGLFELNIRGNSLCNQGASVGGVATSEVSRGSGEGC
jgi:hypothetical protein